MKNPFSKALFFMAIVLISILTAGCPVGLGYPISEPSTEPIDKALIGTWEAKSDSAEMLKVKVVLKTENAYSIEVQETSEGYMVDDHEFDAWVTKFAGHNFIYAKSSSDESGEYYLYEYEVKGKKLAIQDVSLLVGGMDAVTSTETLRKEISASLKLPDCLTAKLEYTKK